MFKALTFLLAIGFNQHASDSHPTFKPFSNQSQESTHVDPCTNGDYETLKNTPPEYLTDWQRELLIRWSRECERKLERQKRQELEGSLGSEAQPKSLFELAAGYSTLTGDPRESYSGGGIGTIGYYFQTKSSARPGISLGYTAWSIDGFDGFDGSFSVFSVVPGLYFMSNDPDTAPVFFKLGTGAYIQNSDITADFGQLGRISEEVSTTNLGIQLAIGSHFNRQRTESTAFLQVGFDTIFTDDSSTSYLTVTLGLSAK